MSITFLETYIIPGDCEYNIEDYEQEGEHFFPKSYTNGKVKRFRLWRGGCGIGSFDSIEEARKMLNHYVIEQNTVNKEVLLQKLAIVENVLSALSGDYFYLGKFMTND